MPLSTIFQLYHGEISFIGGGNRSAGGKFVHMNTLSNTGTQKHIKSREMHKNKT
jgi:hypothetical protein